MTLRDVARLFLRTRHLAVSSAVEEISRDEVIRVIDSLARKRTGMSAAELLSTYRAGRLDMSGDVTDLLVYSDLLAPDDPIFFAPCPRPAESEAHFALR